MINICSLYLQTENNYQMNLCNTITHGYIINMHGVRNNLKLQLTFNVESIQGPVVNLEDYRLPEFPKQLEKVILCTVLPQI